ncbi:hypothetical protein EQP59_09180 [Ornithobacterium rhinotracheale]|uniref:Lipoprotein n=1 Tax=Ornithobacterium rhinotracheale TaxID=28251 RepID=A0A410JTX5_ORNRH|nr:putative zinc-binding metallopeptidase [Ornithobacterium rhinotracheale]MRJ08352.1 hypothetical protein [Ornithobacterium rhinotracheale]QAR31501.1 hypothetical protein EQP59_09180 [Ornithobacterium rhinotracheale]UOH77546.1 putative zinc-binding metallopeptidase [Ornithobacterium rhinotracheale]
MIQIKNIKYSIFALSGLLFLASCEGSEDLSSKSVINVSQTPNSEFQTYLNQNFEKPYNIAVNYQWQNNSSFDRMQLFPPNEAKAYEVAKALNVIWIDLYMQVAGKELLKEMSPAEIKLFGNANIDSFGVEKWQLSNDSPFPFTIFKVDDFNKNNEESMIRLSRNVQNNMAKLMAYHKKFDLEEFSNLNFRKYKLDDFGEKKEASELSSVPFYVGFYSFSAARYDVYEDFAETMSVLLSYPKHEVDQMIEYAATPADDYYKEVERARQAKKTLEAKRDFVTKYLKEEFDIDINVLNLQNLIRLKKYAQ